MAKKNTVGSIAPKAIEHDQSHTFPRDNLRILGEANFFGLGISEEKGGLGIGRACFASVVGEIAKGCASTALIYVSHSVAAKAIELGGSEEVQDKWLPKMLKGTSIGPRGLVPCCLRKIPLDFLLENQKIRWA